MSKYTTDFGQVLRTSAHLVPLQIAGEAPEDFRFKGIVDQNGTQLAAVTERYTLVQNIDIARAVGDALYDSGVNRDQLTRGRAMYSNGQTRFDIHLPGHKFSAPRDPSDLMPTIQIANDYRGKGGIHARVGIWREICTNGLIALVRAHVIKMPHVGQAGYDKIYQEMLVIVAKLMQEVADQKEIAALLASVPAPAGWVEQLLEDTSDRYEQRIRASLNRNEHDLGRNAWAVAQAISEVATHEMPLGWAAEKWATDAVQDLVKVVQ